LLAVAFRSLPLAIEIFSLQGLGPDHVNQAAPENNQGPGICPNGMNFVYQIRNRDRKFPRVERLK